LEKGVMNNIYRIDEIKEKLYPIFQNSSVHRAILFGSYADGSATERSDVDIVIDSNGELLNINFFAVSEDIASALGKRVDLIEFSEIRQNSPLLDEISKKGVLMYECQR
jgi:hypothetical protein